MSMASADDIHDPNFTSGLLSEVHLDYTRGAVLGGTAHKHHVRLASENKRLRAALQDIVNEFPVAAGTVPSFGGEENLGWGSIRRAREALNSQR